MMLSMDTHVPHIIVDSRELYLSCEQIGCGGESIVYRYDDKTAVKIYESVLIEPYYLEQKAKKNTFLTSLDDEYLVSPKGLALNKNEVPIGYYMKLVDTNPRYKDFRVLKWQKAFKKNLKLILLYIKRADIAVKHAHQNGIIIGDIRDENFLIDKNDFVHLIDLDNASFGEFAHDIIPWQSGIPNKLYKQDYSGEDIDKFLSALLMIDILYPYLFIEKQSDDFFKELIDSLNISKEVKTGLRFILSDAHDKPYLSDVIEELDGDRKLMNLIRYNSLRNMAHRASKEKMPF